MLSFLGVLKDFKNFIFSSFFWLNISTQISVLISNTDIHFPDISTFKKPNYQWFRFKQGSNFLNLWWFGLKEDPGSKNNSKKGPNLQWFWMNIPKQLPVFDSFKAIFRCFGLPKDEFPSNSFQFRVGLDLYWERLAPESQQDDLDGKH